MSEERPLVRDDLDIASRVVDDETFYVVGDPIRNEYQQLDELQYVILTMFDGEHTLAQVAAELEEEYEVEVDAEDIEAFLGVLRDLNLLDLASDKRIDGKSGIEIAVKVKERLDKEGVQVGLRARPRGKPPGRGKKERRHQHRQAALFDSGLMELQRGHVREASAEFRKVLDIDPKNARARYLLHQMFELHIGGGKNIEGAFWIRIPLTNPDRFLGRADKVIGKLIFNPVFFVLWAVWCVAGVGTLISEGDRFLLDLDYFFTFAWFRDDPLFLVLMYAVGPFILMGHELSHGLALKHFGGRVREAGILFAYLQATAYCDISSTYLINSRLQRALVSLAGPMFHFALWTAFVFIWQVTTRDSYVGLLALVSLPILGLSVLATGDPFVKNDAYYALTEILDYPNLRPDAFEYFRYLAVRTFLDPNVQCPEGLGQKKWLYVSYAVPGVIGTTFVILSVTLPIAGSIIRQFHFIGLLIVGAGALIIVGPYLKIAVTWTFTHRRALFHSPRVRWGGLAVAVVVLAVLMLPRPLRVESIAWVEPTSHVIRAPEDGVVSAVTAAWGDETNAGAVLLELDATRLQVELARVESDLEQAQLDLLQLAGGTRQEEKDIVRAELAGAGRMVQLQQRQVDSLRRLVREGLAARDELDAARAELAAARTEANVAGGQLHALGAAADSNALRAARARVRGREAVRDALVARIESLKVTSPSGGFVVALQTPLDRLSGLAVKAGDPLLEVRVPGPIILDALIDVTEPVTVLKPGAPVRAKLRGLPHDTIAGRLLTVGSAVETRGSGPLRREGLRARIEFDRKDLAATLPRGLSATIQIDAGAFPLAWHAWLRVVRLVKIDLAAVL